MAGERGNTDDADSGSAQRPASNPLVRGVREFLGSNPVLEETEELAQSLMEADRILDDVKRENQDALRQLTRKPRVEPARPPHVVLIVADDLGFGDLGCYGQQQIRTPHLDRLASEGLRFTDFYAGGPDGAATRWCLLTGYDSSHARRGDESVYALQGEQVVLPEILWQAGYDTAFIGFWGVGRGDPGAMPHQHGFHEWVGCLDDTAARNPHYPETVFSDGAPVKLRGNAGGKEGQYVQDFYLQETLAFLKRRTAEKPFFLMLSCALPRAPLSVPSLAPYDKESWPLAHQQYAAMVSRLDHDVGEILRQLRTQGLSERTLVLFTSDNAPRREPGGEPDFFASIDGLRHGPGTLYEGDLRLPLIAWWPGRVPAGAVTHSPAAVWDLLPTLADLAAVARRPAGLDGVSLVPVLRGQAAAAREMLYWELRQPGFAQAVRRDQWKVVRPAGKERAKDIELYNLVTDPHEKSNLASQHPDIVATFIAPE